VAGKTFVVFVTLERVRLTSRKWDWQEFGIDLLERRCVLHQINSKPDTLIEDGNKECCCHLMPCCYSLKSEIWNTFWKFITFY